MQDPFSLDEKLARRANLRSPEDGGIAQLVERLVRNEKARGSNPLTSTNFASAKFISASASFRCASALQPIAPVNMVASSFALFGVGAHGSSPIFLNKREIVGRHASGPNRQRCSLPGDTG